MSLTISELTGKFPHTTGEEIDNRSGKGNTAKMMSCYAENFRFTDAISECSMRSKARIDSLFEDSRSICSSTIGGWYATIAKRPGSLNPEELGTEEQNSANGAVQARIEAMFASVEAESGVPGESAAAILKVKYIGAAPVGGRVASIRGLQEPLRQLLEQVNRSVNADLEISQRGLTFRTSDITEKTSPFRRIAVWSALRLRCKRSTTGDLCHAFLPLVGEDQSPLRTDEKHADLYRAMRGLDTEVDKYPPIFAVVMRRPGAAKLLECHAFACRIEEDAVAAAATLYRALLTDLDANRRRPRQANGLGCVSLASVASSVAEPSIVGGRSVFSNNGHHRRSETPSASGMTNGHPVRPPRSKKTSMSGSQSDRTSVRSVKVEKAPRKKKISEIKAEDILEARSRKAPPTNARVAALKELRDCGSVGRTSRASGHDSNCGTCNSNSNSSVNRNTRPKNKERNFRNKIMQQENKEPCNDNDSQLIYSEKPEYSAWRMNNYEIIPKTGKSFDYEAGPEIHYSFVERNNDKEVNGDCHERDKGSYDINPGDGLASRLENRYSGRKLEASVETPSEDGNPWMLGSTKSRENSIYSGKTGDRRSIRDKIYEEHFRDADKIYSIGQEDLLMSGKRRNSRCVNKKSVEKYSLSTQGTSSICYRSGKKVTKKREDLDDRESTYGFGRAGAINTMDKPVRKQLQNGPLETKQSDKSIVRKRSRACSEPPVSRTESAVQSNEEPKLTRSQSELEVDRGDPMTRVELPRRCSFLKSGGSTRLPNGIQGGTPLGFTELFDEFRNQEGLTSVDDILAAIIDPEGMSFNDLKPLYKEFLLKLAATLTQDELYQRSASIMRRRRRPQRRRSTRKPCLIGRAIKRSVSRLKGGPTEFTSVIFPAKKLNDSFDSSSSCDIRNNRTRVLASRLSRRHSSWRNTKPGVGQTTSEDSDTGRRLGRNGGAGANRSSSGYVSCSECSYDSESCTCVSADKCYCSLPRRVSAETVPNNNTAVCACDTDSCSDSNKCYCARKSPQPTILEQLRQRGIVPSESTLSRTGSPDRAKTSRTSRSHASSKSLEFLKIRPSPGRSSSDNLALDYDLFSPGKKSQHSCAGSEKVLVVSARDPQGRLVYVGGGDSDKLFQNSASRTEAHHEALSIKKSAEIAAIFGPGSVRTCRRTGSISSVRSSVSLEAGLGYLP